MKTVMSSILVSIVQYRSYFKTGVIAGIIGTSRIVTEEDWQFPLCHRFRCSPVKRIWRGFVLF